MSSHGDQLTPREHAYVRAVLAYASGSLPKANDEFCNMLIDYPLGIKNLFPLQKLILSPTVILGIATCIKFMIIMS